jgi:amidase
MPFAPTFDTVGIHARSAEILRLAATVLLGAEPHKTTRNESPTKIHLLRDAFDLAQPEVRKAHQNAIEGLRTQFGSNVSETTLAEITGDASMKNFDSWFETYCIIQWAEIENSLDPWITDSHPTFGPVTTKSMALVKNLDRRRIAPAIVKRESFYRALREFLGPKDLLCIPTTPAPAPIKGSLTVDQRTGDYYKSALSLTSIAGIGRLPQISLPLSNISIDGADLPIGLSLLGSFGEDLFLLNVAQQIATAIAVN